MTCVVCVAPDSLTRAHPAFIALHPRCTMPVITGSVLAFFIVSVVSEFIRPEAIYRLSTIITVPAASHAVFTNLTLRWKSHYSIVAEFDIMSPPQVLRRSRVGRVPVHYFNVSSG